MVRRRRLQLEFKFCDLLLHLAKLKVDSLAVRRSARHAKMTVDMVPMRLAKAVTRPAMPTMFPGPAMATSAKNVTSASGIEIAETRQKNKMASAVRRRDWVIQRNIFGEMVSLFRPKITAPDRDCRK